MADVGFVAAEAVADVADHCVQAGASVAARPRGVFAGGEPYRTSLRGCLMVGVEREQDVLAQEVTAVDVSLSWDRYWVVLDTNHQIDGLRAQIVQRGRGFALDDFHLEPGCRLGEPLHDSGQEGEGRGLDEGHPQTPAGRIAGTCELAAHGLIGCERLGRIRCQSATGGGQFDVSPDAAEQLGSCLAFELRELHRDGRRGVREGLGDGRDRSEA